MARARNKRPNAGELKKRPTPVVVSPSNPAAVSGEHLEKIREILFGTQVREQVKRRAELEDRLAKEMVALRQDMARGLESLRSTVDQQIRSLSSRLDAEKNERDVGDKQLVKLLKESEKTLGKRLDDQAEEAAQTAREIRQSIASQSKMLQAEIIQKHATLNELLNQSSVDIRSKMVNRSGLKTLLTDMAAKFTDVDGAVKRKK